MISSNADAKLNEQIAQRVKERDSKAQKEMSEGINKKKKRAEEIKQFFISHVNIQVFYYIESIKRKKGNSKEGSRQE